jgi:hypothetical protein
MAAEKSNAATHSAGERFFWAALLIAGVGLYAVRFVSHYYAFDVETAKNGMLARGIIEGLAAPWWNYQYKPFSHGTAIFGLALTPFFYFGGSKYLWTKLLSGAMVVLGAIFWTVAVRRCWGRKPAIVFALLCILPPPRFEALLHASWANHSESLFFTGLLLLLFANKPNPSARSGALIAAGLLGGFACFFSFENALFFAALLVGLVICHGVGLARRLLFLTIPAFLFAFSPHFLTPTSFPHAMVDLAQGASVKAWFWERYASFFKILWTLACEYKYPLLSKAFFLAAVLGYFLLVWRTVRTWNAGLPKLDLLGVALLAHSVIFFGAYGFSHFYMAPSADFKGFGALQYLAVIFPFWLAFLCQAARSAPGFLAAALAAPFLFGGALHVAADPLPDARTLRYGWDTLTFFRGDDNDYLIYVALPPTWGAEFDETARSVEALTPAWRCDGFISAGAGLSFSQVHNALAGSALRDREQAGCLVRGFAGHEAAGFAGAKTIESVDEFQLRRDLARFAADDPLLAQNYFEGFGAGLLPSPFRFDSAIFDFYGWLIAGGDLNQTSPDIQRVCSHIRYYFELAGREAPDPAAARASLFRGFGKWLGAIAAAARVRLRPEDEPPERAFLRMIAALTGAPVTDAEIAALRRGVAAGEAHALQNYANRFQVVPPFDGLDLLIDEAAKNGVVISKVAGPREEYRLDEKK